MLISFLGVILGHTGVSLKPRSLLVLNSMGSVTQGTDRQALSGVCLDLAL